jgi:hypothetical protein
VKRSAKLTVDKHLVGPWAVPGYPFRNAKIGFGFEQTSRRVPRFGFASQMSQGRREAAIGRHRNLVLAESLLGRDNRLIETAKTDECNPHFCKRYE